MDKQSVDKVSLKLGKTLVAGLRSHLSHVDEANTNMRKRTAALDRHWWLRYSAPSGADSAAQMDVGEYDEDLTALRVVYGKQAGGRSGAAMADPSDHGAEAKSIA